MDIQSVLRATFAVPASGPDWEQELLLRLDASDTLHRAKPLPARRGKRPARPGV